jgi:hypothetical protein
MARPKKKRGDNHGSAWQWRQTDCRCYTLPGTKRRVAQFDEQGRRIKGKETVEPLPQATAGRRSAKRSSGSSSPELRFIERRFASYLQIAFD